MSRSKTKFDIMPHLGAGEIKLGMSRSEIVDILGNPCSSSEKSKIEYDDFSMPIAAKVGFFQNELQITFDESLLADYIEFSGKNSEFTTVFYEGLDVFNLSAPKLLKEVIKITEKIFDQADDEIPYSYVFPDLDLSFWRGLLPDLDESVNEISDNDEGKFFWTIGIGAKGYYKHR